MTIMVFVSFTIRVSVVFTTFDLPVCVFAPVSF
jgi:hypothetical protein